MRRLAFLSVALLAVISLGVWLVLPMFMAPEESLIEDCERCPELVALVPDRSGFVVVAPHGGTSFFELGRRIVPPEEVSGILPAPGLVAIGLGNAPAVVWQDGDGRVGVAVAPTGLRRLILKFAAYRYGGSSTRWRGDLLVLGDAIQAAGSRTPAELESLRGRLGHFFAVHDKPLGRSVARLTPNSLEISTFPTSVLAGPTRIARHPVDAALSLAVPDLAAVVEPIEKVLPLKTAGWRGRGGQVVVYGVDARGLLPSIRGLLMLEEETDPQRVLEETVPRVEGMTRDSGGRVGGVEVFRRETLGVTVDAASKDGWLLIAFDGTSMERWLTGPQWMDETPAVWSLASDPGELSEAIEGLMASPGRHLLSSSSRKTLQRLGGVVGAFRTATSVRSRLVSGPGGQEIESIVEW